MALTQGSRIGVYEVGVLIGAGGMGEVYRARDTRLHRNVALKILPESVAGDPERLVRFRREATTLAALNHSNIAHVHGLEESAGVLVLVMELVDGEDLSLRIARAPIPLDESLRIAADIAAALAAAHEQGIIHRDLKPANVKIRPDGTVKVLDFGLAKVVESIGGPSTPVTSQSPTVTSARMTAAGVILGTTAYMSPEQARGSEIDKRTDVWAFGCVLYEMLTRRRAFAGDTISDTIAAVLERAPEWTALPPSTPQGIVALLKRCLQKDRRQRVRDIGDVRLQIEDALAFRTQPAPEREHGRARRFTLWALVATSVLSVIAVLAVLGPMLRIGTADVDTAMRSTLTRVTADDGVTADPVLSRDGALLAYASDRAGQNNLDIWIQQASGSAPIQLTHDPVDEREPAFSPDGRLIAFRSEADGGGIYIVPSLGGQDPRLLVKNGRRPRFSPDGTSIAYWTGANIGFLSVPHAYRTFTVPVVGGVPREIGASLTGARDPVWSSDGRTLMVLGTDNAKPVQNTYDWYLVRLADGTSVKTGVSDALARAGITAYNGIIEPDAWSGDRLLFSDSRSVWSIGFDAAAVRPGGLERLTFGTNMDGQATVADSGAVAFSSVIISGHIWSLPLDLRRASVSGAARRLTNGTGLDSRPSMSSDGHLLAYNHSLPRSGLFVKNLTTGTTIDLGVPGSAFGPAISPDGRYVSYEDHGGVSLIPSRGGAPREICANCTIGDWAGGSSSEVAVVMLDANSKSHMSLVNVDTGNTRDLTERGAGVLNRPFISSGNRLLAFRELDTRGNVVYVARVPPQGTIRRADWVTIVPPELDARPCGWSPDGSVLYFVSARDGTRCLYAQPLDPSTGTPKGSCVQVQHFAGARNMRAGSFGVLSTGPADAMRGGSFLYDLAEASSNIWMISAPPRK
jgi:Tol biopolymer transport system component